VGCLLCVLWLAWWIFSIQHNHLKFSERLWFGKYPAFGIDFVFNTDKPTRIWVQGGNPYLGEPVYPYPPLTHRIFAWTSLMSPHSAMVVFMASLALFTGIGTLLAWQTRRMLALTPIPLPLALAAMLLSFPVVFAMERGNYDLLCIPFIVASIWFLNKETKHAQIIAGVLLSVTPWLKIYPGLLFVGLMALRRWRTLAAFVISALGIGILCWQEMTPFLNATLKHIQMFRGIENLPGDAIYWPWQHSIGGWWRLLWRDTPLRAIPGDWVGMLVLFSLLVWVSVSIYRCANRRVLAYPLLLWILALATFVPVVANDYNLFFLPMAIIALWDKRDPIFVHLMTAPLLLWWQPFYLPIDGYVLFVFKTLGLFASAVMIIRRCQELDNGWIDMSSTK
jgi:hypothetical protein